MHDWVSHIIEVEPHLKERVELAKQRAQRILAGNLETLDDAEFSMRLFLARRLGLPIFDRYFEDRTIDELVFEIELYRTSEQTGVERGKEIINQNREQLSTLFDDMVEVDSKQLAEQDKAFADKAAAFMKTGDFQT